MENHLEIECFEEDEVVEQEPTLLFFGELFRREETDRCKFIDNVSKCMKTWVGKPNDLSAQSMLQAHLPTVLRLSINAPFNDIRERFRELLREVKVCLAIASWPYI